MRVSKEQTHMASYPVIIGRSESIELVDLGGNIPAKIDTGAYRSAIHSSNIRVVKQKDGTKVLKATVMGHQIYPEAFDMEFTDFEKVVVTNSFGQQEPRYEVSIRVKLGPKIVTTAFTLADRSKNFFPILVGRKLLKRRFFVDVSNSGIVNRAQLKQQFNGLLPDDFVE